jgi:endonuclease/exonuclease/phosphatase family metal-dependent hydrolase
MLKIMTFNIRYGTAEDGIHRWENRKELVASRIHAFAPDLLGMQECRNDSQADFIKASTTDHHFYGTARGGDGEPALEMAPILIRKSDFEVLETGYFWLSETPDIPASKSWDSTFPRTATWANILHKSSGRALTFMNTHFDYQPIAIERSARVIKTWVENRNKTLPIIMTGDFNADKNSQAYKTFSEQMGLSDAFRMANPASSNEDTFHGFGDPTTNTPIDWILVSRHFHVLSAEVDRHHEENFYPSDHFPITATLTWKNV